MNNSRFYITLTLIIFFSIPHFGQSSKNDFEIKYRRSSLHRILLKTDDFPKKELVIGAYYNAPFPEKYNDHSINVIEFNQSDYVVTNEDRLKAGLKEKKRDSLEAKNDEEIPLIIEKFFNEQHIGNKLISKWFNRKEDGSFDMSLIADRGFYDATEMQANIAKSTTRGNAILSDAGEELIGNTFVVVSNMNFVDNEVAASIALATATSIANQIDNFLIRKAALMTAKKIYKKTKDGYSVNTSSYLYKLKWNDTTANKFYEGLWVDSSTDDETRKERKQLFDENNFFEMEYIGVEKARNIVLFTKNADTEEDIINRATFNNIARNYVKLQKNHDVFKTKTPLLTGYPITAKIGLKEGIEGGDKYEVLEQVMDPETGLTKYEKRGIIKVHKKLIWDNRGDMGTDKKVSDIELEATTFVGGKNFYAGMLIRQVK